MPASTLFWAGENTVDVVDGATLLKLWTTADPAQRAGETGVSAKDRTP
jgi:hypothetical protein